MVFFNCIFTTTCLILAKTAKYKTTLNKRAIETLLNELFELNDETIKQYAIKNKITVTCSNKKWNEVVTKACPEQQSTFYGKLLALDRSFIAIEFFHVNWAKKR